MLVLLLGGLSAAAQASQAPSVAPAGGSGHVLTVGLRENPPFVMRDADGRYSGIAIELWSGIAQAIGARTRYAPADDVDTLLAGVADRHFDVAVGALTVTAQRAEQVDFTQPFYRGGIGIATRASGGWRAALGGMISASFLKAVGALVLVLLLVGVLVWWFERRSNPAQFGGTPARGIGSGLWWSAVTMTTVGYGDKAPTSLGGRVVGLVWMFVSVITISGFTAAIASSITIGRLSTEVHGVADLPHVRVASTSGSTSATLADHHRLTVIDVVDPAEALRRLAAGQVDAVLYDAPVLQARIHDGKLKHLTVLAELVREEDYALAVPRDSEWRKPINQALLRIVEAPQWQDTLDRYLGADR
ncbi:transporter substrate-binding domain-containing protein [Solimonas terrae]|uniref:Transporter substrate-binding domain-containing protein n=1 Tax=Solimonas terrae TaxID=1396819 RepID=A0A6M2BMA9_9GAMM|nr:transporter substrate-binding domain-containing protein [Solimonas terrae]NGY03548.1 transporter substrate-binding domain-containing protein [Solimonas terrae]